MPAPPRAAQLLPTGTVTFLFTDIEGSTRLWEAQPEAMPAALARHDELMRYAIGSRSGHVFKTVGDAFCAAFHTAPDALAAALEAQRALHLERWPEAVKLRVRMALHTGAVESRDNDYFGAPLSRVARLLAAGHGGQTLLSESTHDLCRDHLPPLAGVKALGEHGLKDLARREAVFQLCHPDLPSSFPPLRSQSAPVDKQTPSIAVLPFVNLSRDEENEYFADGLAEELLNVLSKIRGLRVVSRTSAFSFKGAKVDIPTMAQKLNVATILEGTVRKAGNRVRISAQLIHVATDSHLWSATYDRQLEDIFAVQDDIAQSVVRELRAALMEGTPDASASVAVRAEIEAAARGRGQNAEAYRLYLQASFHNDRLTAEDFTIAIEAYRAALKLDPNYALAWAGLSIAYAHGTGQGWLGTDLEEGFRLAREACGKAMELAPDLAESHEALGVIRYANEWDWKGAEASFARALELAPHSIRIMRNTVFILYARGRYDEAIALLRQAVELDPLSGAIHCFLAGSYRIAGRLHEAESAILKSLELSPHSGFGHFYHSDICLAQGRLDEALDAAKREIHHMFRLLALANVYHAQGRHTESDAALQALVASYADTAALQIAEAFAYRGERDQAFAWLERACAQRDAGMSMVRGSPSLRGLHGDPRWRPFVEKVGLAD